LAQLEVEIARHGNVLFHRLTALCKNHKHGTKAANHPYQFVTYCIRRGGWSEYLIRVPGLPDILDAYQPERWTGIRRNSHGLPAVQT
jgi:hypothetical protein